MEKILNKILRVTAVLIVTLGLWNCDNVIYDYEEDCPPAEEPGPGPSDPGPSDPDPGPAPDDPKRAAYYVEYVFDMNMQFVDAFSEKVQSVDLWVFTPGGNLVGKYHEEGPALRAAGYRMELTELGAGSYELIAWCGLGDNRGYFTVPGLGQTGQRHQVVCTLGTKSDAEHGNYQDENLTALYHGRKPEAVYTEAQEDQVHTIYLTKNTNNINLTLQHKEGLEFAKDRFEVRMHDENGTMLYDNSVPEGTEIEYRPYRTTLGRVRSEGASSGSTMGNYLQVELSTARLLKDHNPLITVTDTETGKTIFSIPLVKWALKLRSSNYGTMEEQEYLDREDNYNLMLWLDNDDQGWFGVEIDIKDWHVIEDESQIK